MTALLLPLKRMTHAPRGQIDHRRFLVVNGELTLLGVWLGGMEGSCNLVPYYKNQINATLAALGGGYNLTEIVL